MVSSLRCDSLPRIPISGRNSPSYLLRYFSLICPHLHRSTPSIQVYPFVYLEQHHLHQGTIPSCSTMSNRLYSPHVPHSLNSILFFFSLLGSIQTFHIILSYAMKVEVFNLNPVVPHLTYFPRENPRMSRSLLLSAPHFPICMRVYDVIYRPSLIPF